MRAARSAERAERRQYHGDSRRLIRAAKRGNRGPADGVVEAGWFATVATLVIPFLVPVPVILGAIAASKGRPAAGTAIMCFAIVAVLVRFAMLA